MPNVIKSTNLFHTGGDRGITIRLCTANFFVLHFNNELTSIQTTFLSPLNWKKLMCRLNWMYVHVPACCSFGRYLKITLVKQYGQTLAGTPCQPDAILSENKNPLVLKMFIQSSIKNWIEFTLNRCSFSLITSINGHLNWCNKQLNLCRAHQIKLKHNLHNEQRHRIGDK